MSDINITSYELKMIHDRYINGENLRQLGHEYKCSHFYLRQRFKKDGLYIRNRKESGKMLGLKQRGSNHPKWTGGRSISVKFNQVRINIGVNKQVLESHYIYCNYYDILKIPKGFIIHHIDHDSTNNSIENLMLMEENMHLKYHRSTETIERNETGQFTNLLRRGD